LSRALTSPTARPIVFAGCHPNEGLRAAYRRKLDALITEMHKSLVRWILAQYRRTPPLIAQDDVLPAAGLMAEMARLGDRWLDRFDQAAPELAKWFATNAKDRSDFALKDILRRGGFTVKFQMTPEVRDIWRATVEQNVGLIRSIATEHLQQVQGAVMRSVQAGHDVGALAKELEARYGVTRNRAALIARHQNAMANSTITRARQTELGITTARWLHSSGGKEPRPSHVKASRDRVTYDVTKGWYDPDEGKFIRPGELISCRCVSVSIIPGLD
jgi:uncharacterized protein with gpF-like domain